MRRIQAAAAQRGFTLVEAIIVIVIIGVLAAVLAVFIRAPIMAYVDSVGRAEVSDTADLALRRIGRDLRLALPNSIRTPLDGSGSAIEFLLTKTGGRYLSSDDGLPGDVLDFGNAAKLTFTVVGPMPSLDHAVPGDYVVVNNLGVTPVDAYQFNELNGAQRNIARVISYVPATALFTLADNPFASQAPSMPSPTQRFQVVSGPVSYYCAPDNGTLVLWRHWGYPISATQQIPPVGGQRAKLASHVDNCEHIFQYGTAASQRSALVILTLQLRARNGGDPAIRLVNQVHVDNTP